MPHCINHPETEATHYAATVRTSGRSQEIVVRLNLDTLTLCEPCARAWQYSINHCHIHPETKLICPKCIASSGGKIGGKVKSEAKTIAARANAKLPRTRKVKP